MASSQVEIAPPSSRFGHVLRDRNHHSDSYRARDLVQTHLNSRISSNSRNSVSGNSNLNQRMDYEDLWVHNPRGQNNENKNDSSDSQLNGISDHSNVNEGSNQSIDFTDLWVHIPERNNDRVDNKTSGKWDRARDVVISIQRKNHDVKLPKPVSNSQIGEKEIKNDTKSEPLSILKKSNNQNRRTLEPIRTREKSPSQSESSVKDENFCGVSSLVSSLVQKWRGYEEESKSLSLTNSPVCGSKVNSSLFFAECPSFSEAPTTTTTNENSFVDWESCKTVLLSGPSSSGGRNSDVTETEPIKVADIIKKLSSSVEEHTVVHESSPRVTTSYNQPDHRNFSPVSNSPRLRGRPVFCDLLMQMERERHKELEGLKECKAVSKFSHKGRIQAMLRLRFLRNGSELKDAQSAILRKKLNSSQVDPVRVSDMNNRQEGDSVKNETETENPPIVLEDRSESNPSRGGDINNDESVRHETESSTQKVEEIEGNSRTTQFPEVHIPRSESINGISSTRCDIENDTRNSVVSDCAWTSDVSHHCNEWEEEELDSDYMQLEEIEHDWINDVSRPRSTWEYLRQARYQEMSDPFQEKNDIRRLLERKSVSSFLSSGLRERIDELMMARTQSSIKPIVKSKEEKLHDEGKGEEAEEEEEEKLHVGCNSDYKKDRGEEIRLKNEASNYDNESVSWVRDNVSSDNHSDNVVSSYIEGSPLSTTYSQQTNHNSIAIELMYELRTNMEQLREEVADLRKSVKSCMNMIESDKSFTKEVTPSFTDSGRKKRKDAPPHTPRFNGGRCCICYDAQMDTLLYRCGHICTCFNCAQELQWGTGKCPVCRAPILDIVQANFHP